MNKLKYSKEIGAYPLTTAHETDAGYDIRTPHIIYLKSNGYALVDTGIHVEIPKGYYIKVESKSGLMCKWGIVVHGGIIDSGYTGTIVVRLDNHGADDYTFGAGDKIAQLIVMKHEKPVLKLVEEINGGERGENGFGSTGR